MARSRRSTWSRFPERTAGQAEAEKDVRKQDRTVTEEEIATVALKQFWHMLLVAGFPVTPQLLMQRVRVSGTDLNSVSSFSVL